MKPDIFMDDFDRTEWSDSHYAVIGRLIVFASRFEALAKSVSAFVGIKKNRSILDSEKDIDTFMDKLRKMPLATHIEKLGFTEGEAKDTFKQARLSRNEIAHELTLGIDRNLDPLPDNAIPRFIDRANILSIRLAKADLLISYLASAISHEEIPNIDFLDAYVEKVSRWVCEI